MNCSFFINIIHFLKLLYFVESTSIYIFNDWQPSKDICNHAILEAKQNGQCTNSEIEVNVEKDCDNSNNYMVTSNVINLVTSSQNVSSNFAFIGPSCDEDIGALSEYAMSWKSPVIGLEPIQDLSVNMNPSTLINVAQYSEKGITESLAALFKELNVTNITLVGAYNKNENRGTLSSDINYYINRRPLFNIANYIQINNEDISWTKIDNAIKQGPRVIVICAEFEDLYNTIYNLGLHNLNSFRFIIVIILESPPEEVLSEINVKNYLYGSNSFIVAPSETDMDKKLQIIQNSFPDIPEKKYSEFRKIYNACHSYCFATTIEDNMGNIRSAMSGKTLTNKFGTFTFDKKGNILNNYAVFSIVEESLNFVVILSLNSSSNQCEENNCISLTPVKFDDSLWSYQNMSIPDSCVAENNCTNYWPHIIAACIFIIAGIAVLVFIYLQRRKRIMIFRMTWKIPKEELKIIHNKAKPSKTDPTDSSQSTLSLKRRVFTKYAIVNSQRAEFLIFKSAKKISLSEVTLKYLFDLKHISNENLTKFIGLNFNDSDSMFVLFSLVERATLEEFCLDPDFHMDNTFKSAFMRDILKGLQFLHKSSIRYHGFLNSSTCVIDANWILKLTNFGVSNLICDLYENGSLQQNKTPTVTPRQFAWFPPEHLKELDPTGAVESTMTRGSQEGDYYCVGLVFYEMITKEDPFTSANDRHNPGLINKIINEGLIPKVTPHGQEDHLLEICKECWNRDPKARPGFAKMNDAVSKVYPTSKGNLVDQMLQMSEKYADELENIVKDRTALLAEAEKQTMRLLNEMLPARIAQDLKKGIIVPPRSYESATVMFVQLCDFPILMSKSSPDEIIFFLNDIFDQFDTVIKRHDAYKVETTGETYMVASGVPHENEGRHITEIAEISLEIRDISYCYEVAHVKEDQYKKIRVKIGFHAGPIAAGVIGIRSPRYCLFGDTVNFASRMQSNCPPNQIQTSEITASQLLLSHKYELVKRGIVHVKGKGEVNCYWLNEHIHNNKSENPEESTSQEGAVNK